MQFEHAQVFQILNIGCQNVSIETLFKVADFDLKIPSRSEDISKKQTEFSRSESFQRSGSAGGRSTHHRVLWKVRRASVVINFQFSDRFATFSGSKLLVAPWCSGYHYCTTSFNQSWTQVLRRLKPCLRRVGDSWWWGSLTMVQAGNKAKCLLSVYHTTKTIHHHHHHIDEVARSCKMRKTIIKKQDT